MTVNTGRTLPRWTKFLLSDGTGMRELGVNSINGVALTSDEVDVHAYMDQVKGALPDTPSCKISISGPFDTTALGSHVVLNALNGLTVPRSLDVQVGIRQAWVSGEPQFGITATATSGFCVSSYTPDLNTGTFTATLYMLSGSSAPEWNTTAEAVS